MYKSTEIYKGVIFLSFALILFHVVNMIYVNDVLLHNTSAAFRSIANVSGIITILINGFLLPAFLFFIFAILYFLSQLLALPITKVIMASTAINVIFCYIIYETLRFLNAFFLLENNLIPDAETDDFLTIINATVWYRVNIWLGVCSILAAAIVFTISLQKKIKVSFKNIIPLTFVFVLVLVLYDMKELLFLLK